MVSNVAVLSIVVIVSLVSLLSISVVLISGVVSSLAGYRFGYFSVDSRVCGSKCWPAVFAATCSGEFCLILLIGFQFSTNDLFGCPCLILLYLSVASRTERLRRRSIGSMSASISQAAVGVVLIPPHMNLRA